MQKISVFTRTFLSNFAFATVTLDGVRYPSVENAYQAAKTLDLEERKTFEHCSALEAKQAGKILNTARPDWGTAKFEVMLELSRQKYALPHLRSQLLATGEALLEEGNSWGDRVWGTCNGAGQNRLGLILMQVREEIRASLAPV